MPESDSREDLSRGAVERYGYEWRYCFTDLDLGVLFRTADQTYLKVCRDFAS